MTIIINMFALVGFGTVVGCALVWGTMYFGKSESWDAVYRRSRTVDSYGNVINGQ